VLANARSVVSAALLERTCGAVAAALGTAGLAGWAFDVPVLKGAVSGLTSMKANTASCFLLGGCALTMHGLSAARTPTVRRLSGILAGTLVALIALATLIEYHGGWDLVIDELLFRDPDTPREFAPGRMAEGIAWGLLMTGLALVLVYSERPPQAMLLIARLLAVGVVTLGGLSILGHLLGLGFLIRTLPTGSMALYSAAGLVALGSGLLAALHPREAQSEDQRIARVAALLLASAAGATGFASIAIVGEQVQETLAQGLGFALQSRINTITTSVALHTGRAKIITIRPNLLKHLRVLASRPDDTESRIAVQESAEGFLPHGFSGIAITLPAGVEAAQAGGFVTKPALEVVLAGAGEGRLVWRDGVFLRHRLPLLDSHGPLGTVLAEQPLPELTATLEAKDAPWRSAEFLLCRPFGQAPMRCFPSRHNPVPFTVVPGAVGVPPRLAYRALAEPAGFGDTVDYRGHPVLGAYDRVGDFGLVGLLKVDTAEIYGPIGQRFGRAIGLGLLLTSIGAGLVWLRVRPLAAALEARVWERTTELWQANAQLAESEQRLRRLNEELDERVRLRTAELMAANQELEAFSYSISHDLRAPLRHIDGFIGLLERHAEPTLDDKGRRYLKTISEAAMQTGALIDDLLTFSHLGRAELRCTPVRLQELVDEVRRILDPEIAGRAVVWAIGELPEVQGDPQLLRLVLQNLIGNALKYTRTKPEARIEIGARHEGAETVCFIRDNGVGFDMRYRERLFGVFQRLHTSAEFEGTGIGLANVGRIVHRHGGRVWADGGVDRGACFSFALPNRSIAPAAEPRQSA